QLNKPDVDYIENLSPAIAIEQRTASANPRSTVATATEIHDYLRLLFARIGIPHCHICGRTIAKQTVEQIVDSLLSQCNQQTVKILAPIVRGRKGEYKDLLGDLKLKGFIMARVDGREVRTEQQIKLERYKKHTIEAVVDSVKLTKREKSRIAESIQTAIELSGGIVVIETKSSELAFSEKLACPKCGVSIEELEPRTFSFNSPYGACDECTGLGVKIRIDPELVLPDKDRSISEGAIKPFFGPVDGWILSQFRPIARRHGIEFNKPVKNFTKRQLNIILYGTPTEEWGQSFEGIVNMLERRYRETRSDSMKEWYRKFMSESLCPKCKGARLKPQSLAVKFVGKSIAEVTKMSIADAINYLSTLNLKDREKFIASRILKELNQRLRFLNDVGLGYLTLDRRMSSLSGGEAQRTQLATQIGSGLTGVLYVLDEPSIGLHQKDNRRLLRTLRKMRDLGNTILVVEHDEETILESDYVIDLGPGAGRHGGYIVATGTPEQIMKNNQSLTGKYLRHQLTIPIPSIRRNGNSKSLTVLQASENNLKNINVTIPLGTFICITGVSGSGKSTFLNEVLYKALANKLYNSKEKAGSHRAIQGIENIDKVIIIDQSPIGRTPRSNPATYIGVFTPIRELFSRLPESRIRGYKLGRFSFNVRGGRCEACQGAGTITIEMHFLPDIHIPCQVCKGKRYGRETLEIRYKGKSISDVLEMTVDEALEFFSAIPQIARKLKTIVDVGLGYIALGQSATTLSGGEAQRVKLSSELAKRSTGKTLYLLDEPTTGLHYADVEKLLNVLQRLVDAGNTVLVIEHNLEVVKAADYIIDLGPEGGEEGGYLIASCTPEKLTRIKRSYTGQYLKKIIQQDLLQRGEWEKLQQFD
ncbi:MAG: excinuclease ABC subunit UvrA, partial [Candidatus Bathyarchaeota archaeon]|nr:excinuclease ABC subunit UvrA [Candidatus Bathyarchaeota archaeon]